MQIAAVEKFHDQVGHAVVIAVVVDSDNVFVTEIAGRGGFVAKTAEVFGVALSSGDLNGYRTIDIRVKAAINATEATSSYFRGNFVFPDSFGHNSFPIPFGIVTDRNR
jgi:hypothetical protein